MQVEELIRKICAEEIERDRNETNKAVLDLCSEQMARLFQHLWENDDAG